LKQVYIYIDVQLFTIKIIETVRFYMLFKFCQFFWRSCVAPRLSSAYFLRKNLKKLERLASNSFFNVFFNAGNWKSW